MLYQESVSWNIYRSDAGVVGGIYMMVTFPTDLSDIISSGSGAIVDNVVW